MRLDGQRVGQYRFLRLLKAGGMGEVYLADDEYLHRRVAIKVIWTDISHYPDPAEASEAARLFVKEARSIAQLDHTHILPVYDSGEENIDGISFMYMVMPFRHKGSLADWLHSCEDSYPLLPREVERIVRQAASALQYAHKRQIIHQDVKPSNFLIYGDAERPDQLNLQLADFGIARFMTTTSENRVLRGTPTYMAPELWNGHAVAATDQYALAVMAYELLTGWPPFMGHTQQQLWHQHCHVSPLPPSSLNQDISAPLDAVLLRALAKDPQDRFPFIVEFAHAFTRALAEEPAALTDSNDGERAGSQFAATAPAAYREHHSKGKVMLLISLALLLVLGGMLAIGYSTWANVQTSLSIKGTATANTAIAMNNKTVTARKTLTSVAQTSATSTTQAQAAQVASATAIAATNATATAQANAVATARVNATATQMAYANATATIQAEIASYMAAIAGTPAVDDSLQNGNSSYNWDTSYISGYGGCTFTQEAYHVIVQKGSFTPCFAQATDFTNFSYEVHMVITEGNQGGIAFRASKGSGAFYYFHINTTGSFALDIYNNNLFVKTIDTGFSPAIATGLNKTNVIAVVAVNNTLTLYVNMQKVASVTDTTFTSGQIGVVAEDTGTPADVAFSDVKVQIK